MKKFIIISLLLVIVLKLSGVYHKIGNYSPPTRVRDVTVVDSVAFLAAYESGLMLVDVSNPQSSILLGSYDTPSLARSVVVEDSIAYVADYESGLQVINISELNNPTLIGSYDTPGLAKSVFVMDTLAFIADDFCGLQIIDISNPYEPIFVGNYSCGGASRSVKVVDTTAYVANNTNGLLIIDINDLQNPTLIGSYDLPWTESVTISDSIAYVSCLGQGLYIIDVSNSQSPFLLGSYVGNCALTYQANSVTIMDSYAYVASGHAGIQVIDISDPMCPTLIGVFQTKEAYSTYIYNSITYVADYYGGLQIVDLTDPYNSDLIGSLQTPYSVGSLAMSESLLYVTDHVAGIYSFNIDDPSNPIMLGNIDPNGNHKEITFSENVGYIGYDFGMRIIDFEDPLSPVELYNYNNGLPVHSIDIQGIYAFLTVRQEGFQILDISDLQNPIFLSSHDTPSCANYITVHDTIAYVTDNYAGNGGLNIFNVSDVQNPIFLGSYSSPGYANKVEIYSSIAYVCDRLEGLQIIDVSDPQNLLYIDTILPHSDSDIVDALVIGDHLLVSDQAWNEILTYEISDPENPILMASYLSNLPSGKLTLYEDWLIVTNYHYGVSIHDYESLTPIETYVIQKSDFQIKNYPNPFNPTTIISFSLQNISNVELSIYNIKGQRVKTIVNEKLEQGLHKIIWDGTNSNGKAVNSGIYFYKLCLHPDSSGKAGNFQKVKKMILLR